MWDLPSLVELSRGEDQSFVKNKWGGMQRASCSVLRPKTKPPTMVPRLCCCVVFIRHTPRGVKGVYTFRDLGVVTGFEASQTLTAKRPHALADRMKCLLPLLSTSIRLIPSLVELS